MLSAQVKLNFLLASLLICLPSCITVVNLLFATRLIFDHTIVSAANHDSFIVTYLALWFRVCRDWFLILWVSDYLKNEAITLPCVPAWHLLNMSRQFKFLSLTSVITSWLPFRFYDGWYYLNTPHSKHSISIHRISVLTYIALKKNQNKPPKIIKKKGLPVFIT